MQDRRRLDRVEDLLREVVSEVMREVKDPAVGSVLLTITGVRVSPDLSHARFLVGVVGPTELRQASIEGLNRASGFMRRELKREVRLRRIPSLTFELDETADRGSRLDGLFDRVRRSRPAGLPLEGEAAGEDDESQPAVSRDL